MNSPPVKSGSKSLKPRISEADIERTCTELLELDGWRSLKTDPVSRREWGKGFGEKGMADRLYVRYQRFPVPHGCLPSLGAAFTQTLWIEWKSLHGRPKPQQLAWHQAERARGGLTLIAGVDFPASIEGFAAWYAASGLQRRNLTVK